MVFLERSVSDALFREAVLPICAEEVSAASEAISGVVREKRLCAGRIPTQGSRARGENSQRARIFDATVGGEDQNGRLSADVAIVERRSREWWSRESRNAANSKLFAK